MMNKNGASGPKKIDLVIFYTLPGIGCLVTTEKTL